MLTDQQLTDLMHRAADTVEVPHSAPLTLGRPRSWRPVLVAAAAVVVAGIGIGVSAQRSSNGSNDGSAAASADMRPTSGSSVAPDGSTSGPQCEPGSPKPADGDVVPLGPDFPTNASGQTYGSDGGVTGATPDLVAVVGSCGRQGYVFAGELEDPAPWAHSAGEPVTASRTVVVYESDGLTQIDTFTVSRGDGYPSDTSQGQGPGTPVGSNGHALEGDWRVRIAGVTREDGSSQYDTYRNLSLRAAVRGDTVTIFDGCQTLSAQFELTGGELELTRPFEPDSPAPSSCARRAPLADIVANVRHVTQASGETFLHLANHRIVLILHPA